MKRDISNSEDIRILVDAFYKRAGSDRLLGSIFTQIEDAGTHKEVLYRYWSSTLLENGPDTCVAFPRHIELMFSAQHFIRWLTIFLETIDTYFAGTVAEKAKVIVIRKSEEFQAKLQLTRF